jgi:hypothetical protein
VRAALLERLGLPDRVEDVHGPRTLHVLVVDIEEGLL